MTVQLILTPENTTSTHATQSHTQIYHPFAPLWNGIHYCYSLSASHWHTYPHCLGTTVEITLFETCFI